jgi:hypothetical protein
MPNRLHLLPLLILPLLAACHQDAASYLLPEKHHAITVMRNQQWFWQDEMVVNVVVSRLPECEGSGKIERVAVDDKFFLYQAPPEYAEPIYILRTGKKGSKRAYAISTQSCRFETFKDMPDDVGVRLGVFKEVEGVFQFVPASPQANDAPA